MANSISNFPNNQLNNVEPAACSKITVCLQELNQLGKPKTLEELQDRIDRYFDFCVDHEFRPGIESLCMALHITRTTFWNWCNDINCNEEWAEIARNAKQFIVAFLEQAGLSGKINPATQIFLCKNWAGYKDAISFDDSVNHSEIGQRVLSADELPNLSAFMAGMKERSNENEEI